jgi:multidrug transporter EmrE-like cation transporter
VTKHLLIFLLGVVLAAVGQVLMKMGASRSKKRGILASFMDRYTMAGYFLMFTSTVTSTIALKVLPLKLTISLLPLGYVLVVLLSLFVLGERLRRNQFWGMLIILVGMVLFNHGSQ